MMIPKTNSRPLVRKGKRVESLAHLAYVAQQPCAVPGCRRVANVHHLRVPGTDAAAGRRSSDCYAVPVCHHHQQAPGSIHHRGEEAAWWAALEIDPLRLAARLWAESRELP